jgi:Spy/CpxP family protein refolding chaperone
MATASPLHDPLADHPVARAAARAPRVQRLTPEQRAELDQQMEEIRAGRARLVPHADVPGVIEEMRRQERG